jgi:hypothetical protein
MEMYLHFKTQKKLRRLSQQNIQRLACKMHNSVHTVKKHTEKTTFWYNVAKVNQNYYFSDITLVTLAEEKAIYSFSIDLIC